MNVKNHAKFNASFNSPQRRMIATVATVIAVAALSRLIPHWPNVTPVMALALVGGAALPTRWLAAFIPLSAMVLSDLALGMILGWEYALHPTQWAVYGSLLAMSLYGRSFQHTSVLRTTFVGGTVAGIGFFLVTNFAVWLHGGWYAPTIEGLLACYAAGLAFYRDGGNFLLNGIVSTWAYTAVMLTLAQALRGAPQQATSR